MIKQQTLYNKILLVALICFIAVMAAIGEQFTHSARADSTANSDDIVYSDVLDDMRKDSSFLLSDYPEKTNDYSLQVLQVAESVNDELFVYVYQPSGKTADLRATSINISKGYKTLEFRNYTLTFINSYKTLYKYVVDDFQVNDTRLRYYDITSIYRAWNADYGDNETGNDNVVNEVPFNVSTIYKMGVENGEFVVESKPTDTIQILSKYVGFVRYSDGFKLYMSACDSHFVAFSTDIPIDELQEADIYYTSQRYSEVTAVGVGTVRTFGDKLPNYSYITDKQDIQYETDGWFNIGTINRDRIIRVDDFISGENIENVYSCGIFDVFATSKIGDTGINNLKSCEWIVRFAETSYSYSPMAANSVNYTIIGDVSILRLEGISNGEHFNMGVIDNKQTGGSEPINDQTVKVSVNQKGKLILALILLILLIILLFRFPAIANIVGAVFKFIWKILTAPFKAISTLYNSGTAQNKSKPVKAQAVTPDGKQVKVRYNTDTNNGNKGGNSGSGGKTNEKKNKSKRSRKKSGFADTKAYPHGGHPANYRRKKGDDIEYLTFTHSNEVHLDDGTLIETVPLTSNINPDERGKSISYVYPKVYDGKRSALRAERYDYSLTKRDKEIVDGLYNTLPHEQVPLTGGSSKAKTIKKRNSKHKPDNKT